MSTQTRLAQARLVDRLVGRFGAERVRAGVPLAPFTTFRVGGPADLVMEVASARELLDAWRLAYDEGVCVTVIGGGSNVLIADRGIRGLVLRVRGGEIARSGPDRVHADAGVTINALVRWTINRGLSGVERWAGTPGTVGGGIFGNAHFQGQLLGEVIESVRLVNPAGEVMDASARDLEFAYDYSRLQRTGEVLLSAAFRVAPGDPAVLRVRARESLAYRKRTQPLESPSAGCIFQNPDPRHQPLPDGIPASAGALVERAGLKGARVGGARVSPTHANFIVNEGQATAGDIRELARRCQAAVRETFGIDLREEIVLLGEFDTTEAGAPRNAERRPLVSGS
jgi:UDP-N-acetylmuramate dehydrogenase